MRFERKFEALLLRVALRHFGLYASAGLGRGRGDGVVKCRNRPQTSYPVDRLSRVC